MSAYLARFLQIPLKPLRSLLSFSHIRGNPIVIIDGGLGSQILGWIKYQTAVEFGKAKNPKERTHLDLEYYLNPPPGQKNLSYFEWELGEYGIELQNLKSNKRPLLFNFSYNEQARNELYLYESMKLTSWVEYFPLTLSYFKIAEKMQLNEDYCAIHLRRGDYLQVAARIVGVDEVCSILNRMKSVLPKLILVISDSQVTEDDLRKFKEILTENVIKVIVGGDIHAAHGILRQAKILIASNSAFSLSAALTMTNNGLVIAPRNFHGPKNTGINNAYHSLSSWNVI